MQLDWLLQLDWLTPWILAFLPLPWLARWLLPAVKDKQAALKAPHLTQRVLAAQQQSQLVNVKQHTLKLPILSLLLWLSLLLAAMQPVWYLTPTPFQQSGKDLILAVDLSGSMQKQDMYLKGDDVDRLTAVKAVVSDFIDQRQGDRMGLVVFGTQAYIQSPLSYDLNTIRTLLNETQIGMAGNNTAIGDAIGLTLKHLRQQKQQNAILILLTDGSNTAGRVEPIAAAEKAQSLGLKIYTIGVGRVEHRTGLDLFFNQQADMDVETLKTISDMTDGAFFLANDTEQLQNIYQEIHKLESSDYQVNPYRARTELFIWPLGVALLLSFWIALLRSQVFTKLLKRQKEAGLSK